MDSFQAIGGALLIALVHLEGWRLTFLGSIPRSRYLSAAGGSAVAYVIVHLLPELAERAQHSAEIPGHPAVPWLVTLGGFCLFYALDRLATTARTRIAESIPFLAHLCTFAAYNGIVGYLLVTSQYDRQEFIAFVVAVVLHSLVVEQGLTNDHPHLYRKFGRWVLAVSLVAGVLAAVTLPPSRAVFGLLFAFIAGGILLNVMREELPRERESRLGAFLCGAAGYAALLVFTF